MSKKIFGNADIKMVRNTTVRGIWIPPQEITEVIQLTNEIAYALYSMYRTYPFKEAEEISDTGLANLIGWPVKKVQKYRLILENNFLFRLIRYGTKTNGITKVFVGLEPVALFDAGLPAECLSPKALTKIKQQLNITTTTELVNRAQEVVQEYELNISSYNDIK